MKHPFLTFALLGLALLWGGDALAVPLAGHPSSNQNKHNLSSTADDAHPHAAAGETTEICKFCHTPHGASPQSTLWNRPDPTGPGGGFPLYSGALVIKGDDPLVPNATDNSQYGVGEYPNGASKLCLSCHDGYTSMGVLLDGSSIAMRSGQDLLSGAMQIDLAASHPISFVYDSAVFGDLEASAKTGEYADPSTLPAYVPLDGQERMQCTTCHDPHEDTNLDGLGYPFWRHDTGATPYDDVCNACHIVPASATGHGL